jgi:hypothetical protein
MKELQRFAGRKIKAKDEREQRQKAAGKMTQEQDFHTFYQNAERGACCAS